MVRHNRSRPPGIGTHVYDGPGIGAYLLLMPGPSYTHVYTNAWAIIHTRTNAWAHHTHMYISMPGPSTQMSNCGYYKVIATHMPMLRTLCYVVFITVCIRYIHCT